MELDQRMPVWPARTGLTIAAITGALGLLFVAAWVLVDQHFLEGAGASVASTFAVGVVASLLASLRG